MCKIGHDLAFGERYKTAKILANGASNRFHSMNVPAGEKLASLGVSAVMKAKIKMDVGAVIRKVQKVKRKSKKTIRHLMVELSVFV